MLVMPSNPGRISPASVRSYPGKPTHEPSAESSAVTRSSQVHRPHRDTIEDIERGSIESPSHSHNLSLSRHSISQPRSQAETQPVHLTETTRSGQLATPVTDLSESSISASPTLQELRSGSTATSTNGSSLHLSPATPRWIEPPILSGNQADSLQRVSYRTKSALADRTSKNMIKYAHESDDGLSIASHATARNVSKTGLAGKRENLSTTEVALHPPQDVTDSLVQSQADHNDSRKHTASSDASAMCAHRAAQPASCENQRQSSEQPFSTPGPLHAKTFKEEPIQPVTVDQREENTHVNGIRPRQSFCRLSPVSEADSCSRPSTAFCEATAKGSSQRITSHTSMPRLAPASASASEFQAASDVGTGTTPVARQSQRQSMHHTLPGQDQRPLRAVRSHGELYPRTKLHTDLLNDYASDAGLSIGRPFVDHGPSPTPGSTRDIHPEAASPAALKRPASAAHFASAAAESGAQRPRVHSVSEPPAYYFQAPEGTCAFPGFREGTGGRPVPPMSSLHGAQTPHTHSHACCQHQQHQEPVLSERPERTLRSVPSAPALSLHQPRPDSGLDLATWSDGYNTMALHPSDPPAPRSASPMLPHRPSLGSTIHPSIYHPRSHVPTAPGSCAENASQPHCVPDEESPFGSSRTWTDPAQFAMRPGRRRANTFGESGVPPAASQPRTNRELEESEPLIQHLQDPPTQRARSSVHEHAPAPPVPNVYEPSSAAIRRDPRHNHWSDAVLQALMVQHKQQPLTPRELSLWASNLLAEYSHATDSSNIQQTNMPHDWYMRHESAYVTRAEEQCRYMQPYVPTAHHRSVYAPPPHPAPAMPLPIGPSMLPTVPVRANDSVTPGPFHNHPLQTHSQVGQNIASQGYLDSTNAPPSHDVLWAFSNMANQNATPTMASPPPSMKLYAPPVTGVSKENQEGYYSDTAGLGPLAGMESSLSAKGQESSIASNPSVPVSASAAPELRPSSGPAHLEGPVMPSQEGPGSVQEHSKLKTKRSLRSFASADRLRSLARIPTSQGRKQAGAPPSELQVKDVQHKTPPAQAPHVLPHLAHNQGQTHISHGPLSHERLDKPRSTPQVLASEHQPPAGFNLQVPDMRPVESSPPNKSKKTLLNLIFRRRVKG